MDEVLPLVRQVLPPEWLQSQVEQLLRELLPYFTGAADTFTLTVPLADRLEAAGRAIKQVLEEGRSFDPLYDRLVDRPAEEAKGEMPLGLRLSREDLASALHTLVPKEWLQAQVLHLVDQAVPYLTSRSPASPSPCPWRSGWRPWAG